MSAYNKDFTPMMARGTVVYLGRSGGFDVCNCPEPEALAAFLAESCNAATIAPLVAAGSVDMVEFNDYLADYVTSRVLHKPDTMERRDRLMSRINAWGAQQREAGRKEVEDGAYAIVIEEARKLAYRAEKAEADLANEKRKVLELQRMYAERGLQIERLEVALDRSEAHAKELEAQLARRRAPLSAEVQQAIAAARAAGQTIATTLGGLVFLNGGTGPGEGELDCPACGGSGHAGDVVTGGAV